MGKKLNIDNPFFMAMGKLGDIILLNVIFLLCCVPVFTIGTAITAMYRVIFQMREGQDGYVLKRFLESFREEFKKTAPVWIFLVPAGAVLVFDVYFCAHQKGDFWMIMGVISGLLLLIWAFLLAYLFAVMARFENTRKNHLKNAVLMAIRHLPYTIVIVLLDLIPLICWQVSAFAAAAILPVYLTVGFAMVAYLKTVLFEKIFHHYGV